MCQTCAQPGIRKIGGEPVPPAGNPPEYPHYLRPIPLADGRNAKVFLEQWLATQVGGAPEDIGEVGLAFLQSNARVARWLYSSVTAAAEPIKYQEIRNSLMRGEVAPVWIEEWRQVYSQYVSQVLAPAWRASDAAGGGVVAGDFANRNLYPDFRFEPTSRHVEAWIRERGAQWVVDVSDGQRQALKVLLDHYTLDNALTVDQLAQVIRPVVGLTPAKARAVLAYREELDVQVAAGDLSEVKAQRMAQNYADRLHRMRARLIATTENSFAFNRGQYDAMAQARSEGRFGTHALVKIWVCGEDERVCERCNALDGQTIGFDETFPGGTTRETTVLAPPAHPACRCTQSYTVLEDARTAV